MKKGAIVIFILLVIAAAGTFLVYKGTLPASGPEREQESAVKVDTSAQQVDKDKDTVEEQSPKEKEDKTAAAGTDKIEQPVADAKTEAPVPAPTPAPVSDQGRATAYTGTIGSSKVHMKIEIAKDKVTGSYYRDENKKEIHINGSMGADGKIKLLEPGGPDKDGVVFEGVFTTQDSVEGIWYTGSYEDVLLSYKTPLPFSLVKEGSKETEPAKGEASPWEGTWVRNLCTVKNFSNIEIFYYTGRTLWFRINAYNGVNSGYVAGLLPVENNRAVFKSENGAEMVLNFQKKGIVIEANEAMKDYGGNGIYFSGEYLKK